MPSSIKGFIALGISSVLTVFIGLVIINRFKPLSELLNKAQG